MSQTLTETKLQWFTVESFPVPNCAGGVASGRGRRGCCSVKAARRHSRWHCLALSIISASFCSSASSSSSSSLLPWHHQTLKRLKHATTLILDNTLAENQVWEPSGGTYRYVGLVWSLFFDWTPIWVVYLARLLRAASHRDWEPVTTHFKHSHWWKRRSRSKVDSDYAWETNRVCECKMDVKSTWMPTWHQMDHVSWLLGLFSKITFWRGLTQNRETMALQMLTTVDLFYFNMWETHMNRNSLK